MAIVLLLALTHCKNDNDKIQLSQNTSFNKIKYNGKELTFIQDILDSSNTTKAKVYVQFIAGDSIFKRLYIFDGKELKYFAGDGLITNFIDTTNAITDYYGIKFTDRGKYFVEFVISDKDGKSASDNWRIEYITSKRKFDRYD